MNLWRSLPCCWHRTGRNWWTMMSVLGIILCLEFLLKSPIRDTYTNDLCCTALLSVVCASRGTDAIPTTRGRSGFAAVERGKQHLRAAVWYTPFLLCPSLPWSHLTLQCFSCVEFRSFFFQPCFFCTSPILTSAKKWNILFSKIFWIVAPEECWGWVLRCCLGKRLSWLNGELRLITVVI